MQDIIKEKVRKALMDMRVQEEQIYDHYKNNLSDWKLIRRISDNKPIYIGSNKYKTIQHIEVYDKLIKLLDENKIKHKLTNFNRNFNEKNNSINITFTLTDFTFDVDGSLIYPTIDLVNSNDGKLNLKLLFGAWRVKCMNGMVIGEEFASIRIKHIGNNIEFNLDRFADNVTKTVIILKNTLERAQETRVGETFIEKLNEAGFPRKIIKEINENVEEYNSIYKENISRDTLWSYYAMLTNWITHNVYTTNIARALYLQTILWRLVRNQIRRVI
jgi:hypothetical protein